MRIVYLLAVGFVALVLGTTAVRAEVEYPYCSIPGFGMGQDCSFATLQQCQAAIRGVGTDCEPNPRFRPQTAPMLTRPARPPVLPTSATRY